MHARDFVTFVPSVQRLVQRPDGPGRTEESKRDRTYFKHRLCLEVQHRIQKQIQTLMNETAQPQPNAHTHAITNK